MSTNTGGNGPTSNTGGNTGGNRPANQGSPALSDMSATALTEALGQLTTTIRRGEQTQSSVSLGSQFRSFGTVEKLRRDNFTLWSSVIISIISPVPNAMQHFLALEHGDFTHLDYRYLLPDATTHVETAAYDAQLDSSLGSMLISTLTKETLMLVLPMIKTGSKASLLYSYS